MVEEFTRSIEKDIVKDYAEKKESIYLETSAKTGENIEEIFTDLTLRMIKRASE